MRDGPLHFVRIPLRAEKLMEVARRRRIALRDLDDGYLTHCILRELWQDHAPAPFVLGGRGRVLEVWGYTKASAAMLVKHARDFGDPALLAVLQDVDGIASKPMPCFVEERRIGFHVRACPVVRLAKSRCDHRAGAEIDAFLARCFQVGEGVAVSREEVYREWLAARLRDVSMSGVIVDRIAVAGFSRELLTRYTHAETREAKRLSRPDVRFEGELIVKNGDAFLAQLEKGIGRHRAFGFGALIVVPPGTPYPRS